MLLSKGETHGAYQARMSKWQTRFFFTRRPVAIREGVVIYASLCKLECRAVSFDTNGEPYEIEYRIPESNESATSCPGSLFSTF